MDSLVVQMAKKWLVNGILFQRGTRLLTLSCERSHMCTPAIKRAEMLNNLERLLPSQ